VLIIVTEKRGRGVQAALAARGKRQVWLAEQLRVDPALLSRVLTGQVERPALWRLIWTILATDTEEAGV
jgi:hypothetical protein